MSKNLDETIRLQSEQREKRIRVVRGEDTNKGLQRAGVALRLANSSAASFNGKNECRGPAVLKPDCKVEKEDSSCQTYRRV